MKLVALHIREFRGIKDLILRLAGKNFVVDGPNGSGKSGVVDAIEFVFTGRIARLEGPGTGGLSVHTHAPHVDKRDNPSDSFVMATLRLDDGTEVRIHRSPDKPKEPVVTPADAKADVLWLTEHPELALSRRELIKFILVEPGERSKAIQALLKLERLEELRKGLTTSSNSIWRDEKSANHELASARTEFLTAAGLSAMKSEDVIREANVRRKILGLPKLTELTSTTHLSSGLAKASAATGLAVNRDVAIKDAEALDIFLSESVANNVHVAVVLHDLAGLDERPELLKLLGQRELVRSGIDLALEDACPLCDTEWEFEKLLSHLKAKLDKADEAKNYAAKLTHKGTKLAADVQVLVDKLETLGRHALALKDTDSANTLRAWKEDLVAFRAKLREAKDIVDARGRLDSDWSAKPAGMTETLAIMRGKLEALKAPFEADDARDYLVVCDERLARYRTCRGKHERLEMQSAAAKHAKKLYNDTVEEHLSRLYSSIEDDLVRFYCIINAADEDGFQAKLDPAKGKLTLRVDFYDRGLFPPGAYHSEGHQDGMGLCLYLALMKQLFGERFTFGVLDDVLMSVDKGHRKQVCAVLKQEFPDTQFVITTHDDVWLHQMISAKLVDKGSVKRFRGWTVEHGPLVYDFKEVWDAIEEHLAKEEISQAAALLRRHLEQVSGELCERFRASAPYRRDADHDLGDLLPAAIGKWGSLLKDAKKVANSWGRQDDLDAVAAREAAFKERREATQMEQWAMNKSVHYNEWANMSQPDFEPVVQAYRDLLACFRCGACDGWLSVTPTKGNPEAIMCDCKKVCVNLKKKA